MDQAMHFSELYYRAVDWGKERGIDLDERYIHEQMEEALKRQKYGDPIGATVNIMHANAGMLAEQFSTERIKSLYTYFDVRANGSISLDTDNIDGMLSAMDDFFGLCEQVRQAKPPADIQEQIKNEGEALRSLLAVKADIAKPISKVADVLKDKLGELLSEHDCDSCKLDKTACPLVTSGVDVILRKTDDYLRAMVLQDIAVLEAIIKQYEPDNFGISKIHDGYMDKDSLAARYSLI